MIQSLSAISWLAVLAAFISYSILGALWYMLLFKKTYLISLGKENEPPTKPAPIFIIGPAACVLVITITTALLMHALAINSYGAALEFALVIGVGYLVANTVNIGINPNIPRPIHYGIITGAYHLVSIVIACMILFAMR